MPFHYLTKDWLSLREIGFGNSPLDRDDIKVISDILFQKLDFRCELIMPWASPWIQPWLDLQTDLWNGGCVYSGSDSGSGLDSDFGSDLFDPYSE